MFAVARDGIKMTTVLYQVHFVFQCVLLTAFTQIAECRCVLFLLIQFMREVHSAVLTVTILVRFTVSFNVGIMEEVSERARDSF